MDWEFFGQTSDNYNAFINFDRQIIAFDQADTPSIDAQQVEYDDLRDVISILIENNVTCYR